MTKTGSLMPSREQINAMQIQELRHFRLTQVDYWAGGAMGSHTFVFNPGKIRAPAPGTYYSYGEPKK